MGARMSVVRPDRNMQVMPEALENRDQVARERPQVQPDELAIIKARIAAARALMPAAGEIHCRDCFSKGRDAVLRAIEGGNE